MRMGELFLKKNSNKQLIINLKFKNNEIIKNQFNSSNHLIFCRK